MIQDLLMDYQGEPLDFDKNNFITPCKDSADLFDSASLSNGYDTDCDLTENTPTGIASYLQANGIKDVDKNDPYSLAEGMYQVSNDWRVVYYDDASVDFDTLESQHDMHSGDNIDDIAYLLSDTTEGD